MPLVLTRLPAPTLEAGQLTYLERQTIDFRLALAQHDAYCEALKSCGLNVIRLEPLPALPDSVFVEDFLSISFDICLTIGLYSDNIVTIYSISASS